ncbi:hybrid sensor histidine kinase/response regulator [Enterovirga aerilata]|uniref:Chemotaxis protein CheA n=1 Tax=Enterovirga aerilata TaxID=2730920 RepID=A0A849IB60_9HYPH|nr:hybrid sensor histidine kinase/response regulator [Enterovirga sp. DB1703]NNM73649.1 hybrid sensor histidine kinase/response regulator [Enterovirga sp. DB1703]
MDDLLRDFLAETGEHLDMVDVELVRFERNPTDRDILRNIFRLVHTIKGTCGFLGLPRLEALAHAAETLMGQVRSGAPVTSELVTLILATIDRIKLIMAELDRIGAEPAGSDNDLIAALEQASLASESLPASEPNQVLLRPLRTGEVPLDVLERAFRETPGPGEAADSRAIEPGKSVASGDVEAASSRTQTVRVALDTLDQLMTTVSELVLTRNQLLEAARRAKNDGSLSAPLQRLSQVTAELQDGIMKTRMQPIGNALAKLPRLLRDLSAELGKEIELVTRGAETELDRQILEIIRDPLIHMVRNCAAHGIEMPAERRAAGKPAQGTITLTSYQEGGAIAIEVSDDGRGLDYEAIRRRAIETNLVSAAEAVRMTDPQVADLIFHPGFSTTAVADSVSGRGVGMDVVKTNVELIGGTIETGSEPGRGTKFKIKLPLTLAIVAALVVRSAGERFAIPQVAIQELVRVRPGSEHVLERINGALLLRLHGGLLPVLDLAAILGLARGEAADSGFVVVSEAGRFRFGLLVEAVIETEEIVVKPMCRRLKHLQLFSGNTILGDGAVALILDPNGIARRAGAELLRGSLEPAPVQRLGQPAGRGSEVVTLLVFRGGDRSLKAVPLSLVTRLEEIPGSSIEQAGGQASVQYRGRLMPLLPIDERTELRRDGVQPVIVVACRDVLLGLAVDEVVDVVEETIAITRAPGRPDLVGTAIVRGRATEIVDLADFLPRASAEGWSDRGFGTTVLLVEDNAFFRDMLTPVLKAAGHEVRTAATADEALRTLLRHPITAVVTDLELPDRPGLDLVEAMRRHAAISGIPVVALGSRLTGETARRARDLGVTRSVAKFDRSGLLAALSELAPPAPGNLAA